MIALTRFQFLSPDYTIWVYLIPLMAAMLFCHPEMSGQQVVLNTRGEKIVVYPDGSWRYYEAGDSLLQAPRVMNKQPVVKSSDPILADNNTRTAAADADITSLALRFSEEVSTEVNEAREKLTEAVSDRFEVEGRLEQARKNRDLLDAHMIESLEDEYELHRLQVKEAQKHLKQLEKFEHKARAIVKSPVDRKAKALNRLLADYQVYTGSNIGIAAPDNQESLQYTLGVRNIPVNAISVYGNDRSLREGKDYVLNYDTGILDITNPEYHKPGTAIKVNFDDALIPRADLSFIVGGQELTSGDKSDDARVRRNNPGKEQAISSTVDYQRAPTRCKLINGGATGSSQGLLAVEKQLFFTYTDEDLRPYFRDDDLVSCYASLQRVGQNTYLVLEFMIASPDARKNFGILESRSLLRLKLLNGTDISLFNTRTDVGKIDPYSGDTIYYGNYLLDRKSEKVLRQTELDKVRVVWSSGYEDYGIVNIDFLINQFACLESGVN